MTRTFVTLLLAATLGVVASFCIVVIDEREQGFRTLLGDPDLQVLGISLNRAVLTEPGLYLRIPGLHDLYRYDRRLLRYTANPKDLYTSEKQLLEVDYYAMWRIAEPRVFFESVRTVSNAIGRLDEVTYGEVRKTLGLHPLRELLSAKRTEITDQITSNCRAALAEWGIELVDLKLLRTDYPTANIDRIFQRMQTERDREAKRFRAEGEEQARTIRAAADLESQKILADAIRDSAQFRGEGDARAASIYAEAYSQDPEFYAFTRSLSAYRSSLNEDTTLILSPRHPYLKHFFSIDKAKP